MGRNTHRHTHRPGKTTSRGILEPEQMLSKNKGISLSLPQQTRSVRPRGCTAACGGGPGAGGLGGGRVIVPIVADRCGIFRG